jgi:hypothetical protein
MKIDYHEEPVLEFGQGVHVCPRAGITNYTVYDTKFTARRERIIVGAVSTSSTLLKLADWIGRCANSIPAKLETKQPNLYTSFCGFNLEQGFKAELVLGDETTRTLNNSDIKAILKTKDWNARVHAAVDLYYEQVKFLAQNRVVDVIICVVPTELYNKIAREDAHVGEETVEEQETDDNLEMNFRRALKAKSMHLGKPLQLMRELSLESNPKTQQDDATKAWNYCTALYYKANQTVPWKLVSNANRPSVCFVGIGFYRSRDRQVLNTSLAQIFNELGNGVILRGTPVNVDKRDRQPHLTDIQAHLLLQRALKEYHTALDHFPGRLVVHKSSNYNQDELDGLRQAARENGIKTVDFVTIMDTEMKLFRDGIYPPYRGTHIEIDQNTHLLYTRGSVEYYRTYNGRYPPRPIEIRMAEIDESPEVLCNEILGLTKMNWNNTQFDGKYPITIACARKVGEIMKYMEEGDGEPQIRYSFYM